MPKLMKSKEQYELLYKKPVYQRLGKGAETQQFIIRVFPEEFAKWKKGVQFIWIWLAETF